jgi:hypothetical protein
MNRLVDRGKLALVQDMYCLLCNNLRFDLLHNQLNLQVVSSIGYLAL